MRLKHKHGNFVALATFIKASSDPLVSIKSLNPRSLMPNVGKAKEVSLLCSDTGDDLSFTFGSSLMLT